MKLNITKYYSTATITFSLYNVFLSRPIIITKCVRNVVPVPGDIYLFLFCKLYLLVIRFVRILRTGPKPMKKGNEK